MNANELLTLLGLAWSRLILYPGGLAAFALIWLSARAKNQELRAGSQFLVLGSRFSILSSIAAAWLGLALLPLPAAAPMSRTTDIVVVLALLEWPQFVAIARELHGADAHIQRAGARRLAAALNSYPTLLLATLALAQPAGSLEIAALARQPSETVESSLQALHWLGAATWTLALAPLLGLGPFQAVTSTPSPWHMPIDRRQLALWIRGCGLATIATLPWLAPFGALSEQGSYSPSTLLAIVLAPIALGGMLWLYHRFTAHQSARRWAKAYLALDAALLFALLIAAYRSIPGS